MFFIHLFNSIFIFSLHHIFVHFIKSILHCRNFLFRPLLFNLILLIITILYRIRNFENHLLIFNMCFIFHLFPITFNHFFRIFILFILNHPI